MKIVECNVCGNRFVAREITPEQAETEVEVERKKMNLYVKNDDGEAIEIYVRKWHDDVELRASGNGADYLLLLVKADGTIQMCPHHKPTITKDLGFQLDSEGRVKVV